MKTCLNCGKKIDTDSKFCTYYGYQFKYQKLTNDDYHYGNRQQYRQKVKRENSVNQYQP